MYARGEKVLLLEDTRKADEPVWGVIDYVAPDRVLTVVKNGDGDAVLVDPATVATIQEVVAAVTVVRTIKGLVDHRFRQ